jgi:DNA-binding winged helix-turn-helix (wHTH) protein/TolB-like protein/Tfp pilus assembly protein PilF
MSMAQRFWTDSGFVLGEWEVHPRHGTLRRCADANATPVQIEPRVMAVLACLARHAGEVVTRDEFVEEVWGGRIVSDEALSRCISLLRHVLADDPREPRFIRTVARVGYTLLQAPAPLAASDAGDEAAVALEPAPAERMHGAAGARRRALRLLAAGGACIGLASAWVAFLVLRPVQPQITAPPPPVTRLLVLPFDTSQVRGFGRDAGDELADEITDSLAHVERLRISGRTSAAALAASHTNALEAGRRLGVDAVLDGAVAESAQGLRVTARLTATSDARVMWSRVYERRPEDIFAVQSSIASAVVRELVGLLNRDALAGVPSVEPDSRDLQTYWLYLRGAHQVRLRGEDSLRMAVDLFSAAARRDPAYARAQVGLATAYALLPSYTLEDPTEMYALADKALVTAERLAHSRSISAGTRAYVGFMRQQWTEAESAFRTAIAVEPNNPDVRQMYSQLLGAAGRLEAALQQAHLARELDPLAPAIADRIGIIHLWLGQDSEAASDMALARELGLVESSYPETRILLKLHQHADAEAADLLRKLQHAVNRSDEWIEPALSAYRHADQRTSAIELLDRARNSGAISSRLYFGAMVLLESPQRAMRAFATLSSREANDVEFLFSGDAAAVRRDAGFGDFARKVGLEAYWDRFGWPGACRRDGSQIVCR